MSFTNELHIAHLRFLSRIHKDGHEDILLMPYAEYTLQCFAIYKDTLCHDIFHENSALTKAFRSIGVEEGRDHLLIFLDTLYLCLRTEEKLFN